MERKLAHYSRIIVDIAKPFLTEPLTKKAAIETNGNE